MGVDGIHAAVAIAGRERRIVAAFRSANVTSPVTARPLSDVYVHESWAVDRLIERAVLRQPEPGTYYLDGKAWQAFRGTMRRRLLIAATIVLVLAIGVVLVNVVRR